MSRESGISSDFEASAVNGLRIRDPHPHRREAQGATFGGRLGWWLVYSAALAGSMLLALSLSPDLGFLVLILPLFPVILLIHALINAPYRGSWPFALSGALFTSWLLVAVFPIV